MWLVILLAFAVIPENPTFSFPLPRLRFLSENVVHRTGQEAAATYLGWRPTDQGNLAFLVKSTRQQKEPFRFKSPPPLQLSHREYNHNIELRRQHFKEYSRCPVLQHAGQQIAKCLKVKYMMANKMAFEKPSKSNILKLAHCDVLLYNVRVTCRKYLMPMGHSSQQIYGRSRLNPLYYTTGEDSRTEELFSQLHKRFNQLVAGNMNKQMEITTVKRQFQKIIRRMAFASNLKEKINFVILQNMYDQVVNKMKHDMELKINDLEKRFKQDQRSNLKTQNEVIIHMLEKLLERKPIPVTEKEPSFFTALIRQVKIFYNWIGNIFLSLFKSKPGVLERSKRKLKFSHPNLSELVLNLQDTRNEHVINNGTKGIEDNNSDVNIDQLNINHIRQRKLLNIKSEKKRSMNPIIRQKQNKKRRLSKGMQLGKQYQTRNRNKNIKSKSQINIKLSTRQNGGKFKKEDELDYDLQNMFVEKQKRTYNDIQVLDNSKRIDTISLNHNLAKHNGGHEITEKMTLNIPTQIHAEPSSSGGSDNHISHVTTENKENVLNGPSKLDWDMLRNIETLTKRFLDADDALRTQLKENQRQRQIAWTEGTNGGKNNKQQPPGHVIIRPRFSTDEQSDNYNDVIQHKEKQIMSDPEEEWPSVTRLADVKGGQYTQLFDRRGAPKIFDRKVISKNRVKRAVFPHDYGNVGALLSDHIYSPRARPSLLGIESDFSRIGISHELTPALHGPYIDDVVVNHNVAKVFPPAYHDVARIYPPPYGLYSPHLVDIDHELSDSGILLNHPGGMDTLLSVLDVEKDRILASLKRLKQKGGLSVNIQNAIRDGEARLKKVERNIKAIEKERVEDAKKRQAQAKKDMQELLERRTKSRLHELNTKIKDLNDTISQKRQLKKLNQHVQKSIAEKLRLEEIQREDAERRAYDAAIAAMKKERQRVLNQKISNLESRAREFDRAVKESNKQISRHHVKDNARKRLINEFEVAKGVNDLDDFIDLSDPGYKIAQDLLHEKKIQNSLVNRYIEEDAHVD